MSEPLRAAPERAEPLRIEPRWAWTLRDADGVALKEIGSPVFEVRFDAEKWLGEHWRDLAAQGVLDAELSHAGAVVGKAVRLSTD